MAAVNIVDVLKSLHSDNEDEPKETNEADENRTACRVLNIHLREFFDDIHVPYDFFKNNDWKVHKVLYDNEDALFYNKKYLTEDDKSRFYEVFDRYIAMIEEIMDPNNKLINFLKRWTDMSGTRWRTNGSRTYLKTVLLDPNYQFISPLYTTELFCYLSRKHQFDNDSIRIEMEKHLDILTQKIKKEIRTFKKTHKETVMAYVYEFPLDVSSKRIYVLAFVNSVILSIIDFVEKLLDLHVYAIHPIVNQIIDIYLPLDEINQHKSAKNGGGRMYVV